MKWYSIFLFIAAITFSACSKNNNAPSSPKIAVLELAPNTVTSGHPQDTVNILLRYTIEGKQLITQDNVGPKIVYVDSRFDTTLYDIPLPADVEIKEQELEAQVTGTMTLRLDARRFFIARASRQDGDTLTLDIHLLDRNGTKSNTVTTSNIYIAPQ